MRIEMAVGNGAQRQPDGDNERNAPQVKGKVAEKLRYFLVQGWRKFAQCPGRQKRADEQRKNVLQNQQKLLYKAACGMQFNKRQHQRNHYCGNKAA